MFNKVHFDAVVDILDLRGHGAALIDKMAIDNLPHSLSLSASFKRSASAEGPRWSGVKVL
jgi:hypothetical protein